MPSRSEQSAARRGAWRAMALAVAVVAVVVTAVVAVAGCIRFGYVVQAGLGQLELWGNARPIDEVVADPDTDARTRILLSEVAPIRDYADAHGLDTQGNYRKFVQLDRRAVVWFMAASEPLSFSPKAWSFPIVGSFTYLGWFSRDEAQRIGGMMRGDGWDVYIRPVRAYSTGGWFRDPVLSTMLSPGDDAYRYLINVLFHELTHANVLIANQSTFNESIASFVGDTMAEEYMVRRFGADSSEVEAFRADNARYHERGARMLAAYRELEALYASAATDAAKRAKKRTVLDALERDLDLTYAPNNASLVGFKTYNAGLDELAALYATCGRDWHRFFAAVDTLNTRSFGEDQTEDVGPPIAALAKAGCPAKTGLAPSRHRVASARPSSPSRGGLILGGPEQTCVYGVRTPAR